VIAVLALAIGANTAMFTLVDAILIRPLPLREPARLITFTIVRPGTDRQPLSLPDVADFLQQTRTVSGIVSMFGWSANLTGTGEAERLSGMRVSADYFDLTGTPVELGRALRQDDERSAVAVISHGMWQRRFGGAADAIGKPLVLNGETFTVVGVLRPDFISLVRDAELVVPYSPSADVRRSNRAQGFLRVIARLNPGVTLAQATDDLGAVARRMRDAYPDAHGADTALRVVTLHEEISGRSAPMLWTLLAAVILVLFVACANVANLFFVRGTTRARELAVRAALGASRGRLARQLLGEAALLGVAGGALGLVIASVLVDALLLAAPTTLPRATEVTIDLRVAAVTLLLSLAASLVFGVVPAWHCSRASVRAMLQQGERGSSIGGNRIRKALVFAEVALSTVLLMIAGLLARSYQQILAVDPGFRPAHVLTIRLSLPRVRYHNRSEIENFLNQAHSRVSAIPGVHSAAASNVVPMNGYLATTPFFVDGADAKNAPEAHYRMISPDYFRTLGIAVRRGRTFTSADRSTSAPVAIVNETLARQYLVGVDPVGRRMRLDDGEKKPREVEIVGVVSDVRHFGLEKEAALEVYVPIAQVPDPTTIWLANNMYWVVTTEGEPLAAANAVRNEIAAVDAGIPASFVRSMDQWMDGTLAPRRFNLELVEAFAAAALLLAAIGVYAVTAAAVTSHTREIGIRSALGASRRELIVLVLRGGLTPVLAGLVAGVVAAIAAGPVLSELLFGVTPADLPSLFGTAATLGAAALLATCIPAVRALQIDPIVALRAE
jgi:putative ABC transport system permease protein